MLTIKHKRNNLDTDMGVQLRKPNQKGFTLIEIVLVLAIAGIIFVIVFLAVQAANKGKKDTAAKSAAARLLAAAEQFSSNHDGVYPDDCTDDNFATKYFNSAGEDNSGGYKCSSSTPTATNDNLLKYEKSGTNLTVTYWSASKGGTVPLKN